MMYKVETVGFNKQAENSVSRIPPFHKLCLLTT